ncbi:MAG: zinc ribbon domain-containing protein [Deltaproteobacteria bacterium]|nr:zinc ribbon domain-containing protein [Deltaproteobacteria bacterium]
MPIYEFKCPRCGAKFEELVSRNATDKVVCPECGEPKPVRQMSTFARGDDCESGYSSTSSCGGRSGFS